MNEDKKADTSSVCASCGTAGVGDMKLKDCDGCDLVRYCGDECERIHKSDHEEECKKRAAELRDELLFKQPESSHFGDCPICCVPLPLEIGKSTMMACCSKLICKGCGHANNLRENEMRLKRSCVFCRAPIPVGKTVSDTGKGLNKQNMKRAKANNPYAIFQVRIDHYKKGHYSRSLEY